MSLLLLLSPGIVHRTRGPTPTMVLVTWLGSEIWLPAKTGCSAELWRGLGFSPGASLGLFTAVESLGHEIFHAIVVFSPRM